MPRNLRSDTPQWSIAQTRHALERLIEDRIVGEFGSVELTELLGTKDGDQTPRNVLTVAVLRTEVAPAEPDGHWVTNRDFRPRIEGYRDWRFGVFRTVMGLAAFYEALDQLAAEGVWMPTSTVVAVGTMEAEPARFVPGTGTERVPVSAVLQNNFWNGSHVFTLTDPEKTDWLDLFASSLEPLAMLAESISPHVPWELSRIPDLTGDIVIQVPVTSVMVTRTLQPEEESIRVSLAWNEGATPRPVIAAIDQRNDQCIVGSQVTAPFTDQSVLPLRSWLGQHTITVWDHQTATLLAATSPTSVVQEVNVGIGVRGHEPREFVLRDRPEGQRTQHIELTGASDALNIGRGPTARDRWRKWRTDVNEVQAAQDERRFIQYLPGTDPEGEHHRILDHVRHLIGKHGDGGVWLWDAYLSSEDILETLFFCPHSGVELRALTRGLTAPDEVPRCDGLPTDDRECTGELLEIRADLPRGEEATARERFVDDQRAVLESDRGNKQGLNLEYRISHSRPDSGFHGRYLIFPELTTPARRSRAWDLGSSLNSIGKSHHAMQEVSNAQAIAAEFDRRWIELTGNQHLIWSSND